MRKVWYPKNKEKHIKLVAKNNGKYRKQKQSLIDKLKDVKCADCGNKFPPCAMDFDHISGTKDTTIAGAVSRSWSKNRILKEVEKCEVVCANCHRIRTFITRRCGVEERSTSSVS